MTNAVTPARISAEFEMLRGSDWLVRRGRWLGLGPDRQKMEPALERLDALGEVVVEAHHELPANGSDHEGDDTSGNAGSELRDSEAVTVALRRELTGADAPLEAAVAATDRGLVVGLRPSVSVRVVRDGVGTDHRIGPGTEWTLLVLDYPFELVSMVGASAEPGSAVVRIADSGALQCSGLVLRGQDEPVRSALAPAPVSSPVLGGSGALGQVASPAGVASVVDEMLIGAGPFRGTGTEVTLQDELCDPAHAGFLSLDNRLFIVDLHSSSGTYVRDDATARWRRVPPEEPAELLGPAEIRVGRSTLKFAPASN
jgi:hypothetical protein